MNEDQTHNKVYCIYTDKYWDAKDTNEEHIIPLSLGGNDRFVIRAHTRTNNKLGSEIEGKMSDDFIIKMHRKQLDVKGHNRKEVKMTIKKSILEKKPIQVSFCRDRLEVYDPIKKVMLDSASYEGKPISSQFKIDLLVPLKFIAKVALSSGYFSYGDTFRQYCKLGPLRKMLHVKSSQDIPDGMKGYVWYTLPKPEQMTDFIMFKLLIEKYLKSSCVVFMHCKENILIHVGILGKYIGSINVNAQMDKLPNDGNYRLGHIIYFRGNRLIRESCCTVMKDMSNKLDKLLDNEFARDLRTNLFDLIGKNKDV